LLIAAGWLIYLVCAFDFSSMGDATPAPIDPPKRLVAGRLYRLTRNPMYVGVLMAVLGDAIVLRSIAIVEYAAVIAILFHLFVVYYEESALRRKFGESYVQYSARVPRWFGRRAK
jgi:protein-S-isoprenylcysteine O-methyltransferase Ste14